MERDDALTKHTGFPSFSLLLAMLSFFNSGDKCENILFKKRNVKPHQKKKRKTTFKKRKIILIAV